MNVLIPLLIITGIIILCMFFGWGIYYVLSSGKRNKKIMDELNKREWNGY